MKTKYFFLLVLFVTGCADFLDIDPPTDQVITETVFESDAGAISAIKGIYSQISENYVNSLASAGLPSYAALSADEFINHRTGGDQVNFYTNSLTSTGSTIESVWSTTYSYIYASNSILEGLAKSTSVTTSVKNQVEGEAKFIRAFCHFYMVNAFGNIPYVTTTDYRINNNVPQLSEADVYVKIVDDLTDAENLLADDYSFSQGERIRVNKWAATAMLARVYLYIHEWEKAETKSTLIINNSATFILASDLNSVFLKNSQETIWQLFPVPVTGAAVTGEAHAFIIEFDPAYTVGGVSLSDDLLNDFEPGDDRATAWVGNFTDATGSWNFAYKYKENNAQTYSEYSTVLRLAEQYLVRAEARAQQNKISESQADLDAIRNRAGLANTTASDKTSLLAAIEQERRVELFSEWGHRWLDLKRTNRADAVLAPIKGSQWQPTDKLYPIPQAQIDRDHNMTQNDGY